MKPRNRYKVPQQQWRKWSDKARGIFNQTFFLLTHDKSLYLHPKQEPPKDEHWRTTAWNTAWTAAEVIDGRW